MYTLWVGMKTGAATVENSKEVPQKLKTSTENRQGDTYTYDWFTLYSRNQMQHCKTIILQLKIKDKTNQKKTNRKHKGKKENVRAQERPCEYQTRFQNKVSPKVKRDIL